MTCQEPAQRTFFIVLQSSERLEGEWEAAETGVQSAGSKVWLWALDSALIVGTHTRLHR